MLSLPSLTPRLLVYHPSHHRFSCAAAAGGVGSTYSGTSGSLRVDEMQLFGVWSGLYSPTPTLSSTSSLTASRTPTVSPTGSVSVSSSPSATLSAGASASETSTPPPSFTPTPTLVPVAIAAWLLDGSATASGEAPVLTSMGTTGGVNNAWVAPGVGGSPYGLSLTRFPSTTSSSGSAGLTWQVGTIAYAPYAVALSLKTAAAAARHMSIQYRTSSSGNWVEIGQTAVPVGSADVWVNYSVPFPAAAAAAGTNLSPLYLRAVTIFAPSTNAYASAGGTGVTYSTNAAIVFDNVIVWAVNAPPPTPSGTTSGTRTPTLSRSSSPTNTPSITGTPSPTASLSGGLSPSATLTPSATPTVSPVVTLALWNFEGSTGSANASVAGATPVTATGTAQLSWSNQGSSSSPAIWASITNFANQGEGNATAGFQWCLSTMGYTPSSLSFDARASSSSPRSKVVQVLTYPGGPWADVALVASASTNNEAFVIPLTSAVARDSMLNNNANLCFRLVGVFEPGSTSYAPTNSFQSSYGTTGSLRIDNLLLVGRPTEPSSASPTPSNSRTATSSVSASVTPTGTSSVSLTASVTSSLTATPSGSVSVGATASATSSLTASVSATTSPSATGTPSNAPVFNLVTYAFEYTPAVTSGELAASATSVSATGGTSLSSASGYTAGTPVGAAVSISGWPSSGSSNASAGFTWCLGSTAGFTVRSVAVDMRPSSNAAAHRLLQYRVGGTFAPWTSVGGTLFAPDANYKRYEVALYDPAVNNVAGTGTATDGVCFRVVQLMAEGTNYVAVSGGAAGYSRFSATLAVDNLAVTGLTYVPPSTTATTSGSASITASASFGSSASPSITASNSLTASQSGTPTNSATRTPTRTGTASRTPTGSLTPSSSVTSSSTGSLSVGASPSSSVPPSFSPTPSTAATLAFWTFEAQTAEAASGLMASSATLTSIGGVTPSYSDQGNWNAPAIWYSTSNYPSQGTGNATAGIQWCVSTAGYEPRTLSYSVRTSSSAARHRLLQARADAASSSWQTLALITTSTSNDETVSLPLAPFAASLSDAPSLCFRLVAVFAPGTGSYAVTSTQNSYSTTSSLRIDNLLLTGVIYVPPTSSLTSSITPSPSASLSSGVSASGSTSATATVSGSITATGSVSATRTPTRTGTASRTPTGSLTPSSSVTSSSTGSLSVGASPSSSVPPSFSPTPSTAATLAFWTFEAQTAEAASGLMASSATLTSIGGVTPSYSDQGNWNAPAIWYSTSNYPSQGTGNATAGIQWCVSTAGYEPRTLSYSVRTSSSAARHRLLQARADAASSSWQTLALITTSTSNDETVSLPLAPFAASLSDAPSLCFRLVAVFAPGTGSYAVTSTQNSYSTTSSLRIDNLLLTGVIYVPPTSSLTSSITPSPSASLSSGVSASGSSSGTSSLSASRTPSRTGTGSWTPSKTGTISRTPQASGSSTLSGSPTLSGSKSGTATVSGSPAPPTSSNTGTPPLTSSPTASNSYTPTGSVSVSGSVSATPSVSGTGTSSVSVAPSASGSRTPQPSGSATKSRVPSPSRTKAPTRSKTATKTKTKTRTKVI